MSLNVKLKNPKSDTEPQPVMQSDLINKSIAFYFACSNSTTSFIKDRRTAQKRVLITFIELSANYFGLSISQFTNLFKKDVDKQFFKLSFFCTTLIGSGLEIMLSAFVFCLLFDH